MEVREEGDVAEENTELTLEKKIEGQLNQVLASGDQVAAVLCPPLFLEELGKALESIKEKSPAVAAALQGVSITPDSQEGLTEPVVLGLRHLTVSFLSERFSAFLDWMQSEYAGSMGLQNIPMIPRIEELRMLFLLDAWLVWRAKEQSRKPDPLWSPSADKVRVAI